MKEAREAFAIRSPPEIGTGVERSGGRALETRRPAEREQPTEDGLDRHVLNRQRRFAFPTPHPLIRIREQRIDDIAETRSGVQAIFVGELFRSDIDFSHVSPPRELYRLRTRAVSRHLGYTPRVAVRRTCSTGFGSTSGAGARVKTATNAANARQTGEISGCKSRG